MDSVMYSAARNALASLLDKVSADKVPVEIIRRDKPSVVVVDKDEYDGLMETVHLLSSPANAKRLADGIAELDSGKGRKVKFGPDGPE